jgi:uncharacterized RDD family membrane protein YckC
MLEEHKLHPALTGQRVFNFIIDQLALVAIVGIVQPAFGVEAVEIKTIQDIAAMPKSVIIINYVVLFMYYFGLEYGSGTTLGKLLSGTYVQFDASQNRVWLCFVRTIIRMIPLYTIICMLSRGKYLHDRASSSVVDSHRPPIQIN